MAPDTLTIAASVIGTGVVLAALNVGLFAWLRTDIRELRERMSAVEKEQARTSGLLEGLGLTGRVSAPQSAQEAR